MVDFKSYFHNKYQGGEDFIENIILPIFGENKYEDAYEEDVLENNPELTSMAHSTGVDQILRLGRIDIPMNPTDIFDITVDNHVQMKRNRVAVQQLIRRIIPTYSSAFMIFHYNDDDKWDWRFSFCSKQGNNQQSTDSKRYTFLLGPNQSCRTAADNFKKLADKCGDIELEDIVKAFDVEALSKEFFAKYKIRYGRFVAHVIGKEYVDKGEGKGEWHDKEGLHPSELFYGLEEDEKVVRDYVKKLLGRIVFLHFLQKKGWLGATDEDWTNGPQDFMLQLFEKATDNQKENFLDDILEPLFTCLDTPLNARSEVYDTKVDGLRSVRVPFLGGLFERTEEDKAISVFPSELFADLFKFLSEYNFTIDENDPNDAQVGVDPEMLGRIFENLLEDNKDKGAFYTPKEIVQYMCRESLIAYLQTDVTDEATREALRQFVTTHDVAVLGGRQSALALNVSQCLKDVKICDPAIGSGAFPMGLLNELFICRGVIEDFANAADIKRHIIQQNIYGVDIEKGAVEIARLRFWLSLITDADKPDVLPNMDFKIMQGNSLLEQYKGVDLSQIMETKNEIHGAHQLYMFETNLDVIRAELKRTIQNYYSEQNHDMRRTMREGIQKKIQQQIEVQGFDVDISDIKDIASTDKFFLWHTWFSEVFEKGGFDIVIGNPPYINVQLMSEEDKPIYKKLFSSFFKRCDIFALFIEKGLGLSSSDGILTYIIPSVIHSNLSYQKIRDMILNKHWLAEVCYTGGKVFNAPTVDTTIIRCNKHGNDKIILKDAVNFSCHKVYEVEKDYFSQFQNVISIGERNTIYDKLFNKNFITIGSAFTVFQGIVTGNNPAFIFENEDDALAHGVDTVLLHPLCHGRDIGRYEIKSRERRILYIDNSIDIEDYPNTKKWLLNFKEQLEKRNEGKKDIISWCSLHRPRVKSELDITKKILIQRTRNEALKQRIIATIDEEGVYGMEGIYFIIPKEQGVSLYYLLGILNSKLMNYLFATKFLNLAIKAEYLKQVMIPSEFDRNIITLVKDILQARRLNPEADTSSLEVEIDQLVYQLYGLTDEEIAIVEGKNG